jgi:hypothetical protein
MTRLTPRFPQLLLAMLIACITLPALAQSPTSNGMPETAAQRAQPATPGLSGLIPKVEPAPVIKRDPATQPEVPEETEPDKVAPPVGPSLSDLGRSLRTYFTEDELELLFQYMKESVIASFKGEEVSLPPDLSFKLEILLVRLKKESDHYMDNLIRQMEEDLKNSLKQKLKETLTPPPIKEQPYNPWLSKP